MAALANGSATLAEMPEEVLDVLRLCETYRIATNGAFDAKRPDGVIDPTGIVKTWAVANATRRLGRDTALADLSVGRCGCAWRRIPSWYRGPCHQGGSCGFTGARCGHAGRRFCRGGDLGKCAGCRPHLGSRNGRTRAALSCRRRLRARTSWSATCGRRRSVLAAGRSLSGRLRRGSRCSSWLARDRKVDTRPWRAPGGHERRLTSTVGAARRGSGTIDRWRIHASPVLPVVV